MNHRSMQSIARHHATPYTPQHSHIIQFTYLIPSITSSIKFTWERSLRKTSIQLGMDLKKLQKQGRNERTQED